MRRHAQVGFRHVVDADEVDHRCATERQVVALHQRAELTLGHSRLGFIQQRRDAEITECGADAHPFDLLVGLAHAQAGIVRIEIHELDCSRKLARLGPRERAHDAEPLEPAAVCFLDRQMRPAALGPAHISLLGKLPRVGNMVVMLDPQHVALAGHEQHKRFRGRLPNP